MKNRILDISDCSESPLLSHSRSRHRNYQFRPSARLAVRRPESRPRSTRLAGFTEVYFKGVSAGSSLDFQLEKRSLETDPSGTSAAPVNISYQARCAERWWAEFRRWFGSLA